MSDKPRKPEGGLKINNLRNHLVLLAATLAICVGSSVVCSAEGEPDNRKVTEDDAELFIARGKSKKKLSKSALLAFKQILQFSEVTPPPGKLGIKPEGWFVVGSEVYYFSSEMCWTDAGKWFHSSVFRSVCDALDDTKPLEQCTQAIEKVLLDAETTVNKKKRIDFPSKDGDRNGQK